ncbi:MAG: NifB/NifX family molybdenum-iron cluster-binding protein [Spirochaetes bacterium]|nr:NifB/NifX family molybdenum-iron cluster-binding protein [Spirochaetota bacterium]
MTIAVPTTEHGAVDPHFGNCDKFTLFTVDRTQRSILSQETLPSPGGCGCRSDLASILASKGVTVLLTSGIGPGAMRVLEKHGIRVVRGATGRAEQAVQDYLSGRLTDSEKDHDGR